MCDINKKTDLTTKIIYKVVRILDGKYYAYYSGLPIEIGKVDSSWEDKKHKWPDYLHYKFTRLYNNNMIGKTSGFATLKAAMILKQNCKYYQDTTTILKIKLGGEIWKGNGKNISSVISNDIVTYAGTEILSFEEI